MYLFGHARGTWVSSKLQGLGYYFPENSRWNSMYYESETLFKSSLPHIFEFEILALHFFLKKNSLTWEVKCEN